MSRFVERLCRPMTRKNRKAAALVARPRLVLERLEDRLTPAMVVDFFPTAVVQVNPQPLPPEPLPPTALVLFIPEPGTLTTTPAAGATTRSTPFHTQGELTESIHGGWHLKAVYSLDGQITKTETPRPLGSDSINASYRYEAHVTETLFKTGGSPVWVCDAAASSQGALLADFHTVRASGGSTLDLIDASFHDTSAVNEVCRKAGGTQDWMLNATFMSQGDGTCHERRRYYKLTPLGRRALELESRRLEALVQVLRAKRRAMQRHKAAYE